MAVFGHGIDQPRSLATGCRIEAMHTLAVIPTIISSARHDVDFFPRPLAHVDDPLPPTLVEVPAPGVARAERLDLRAVLGAGAVSVAARIRGERIVGGNPVGLSAGLRIDVNAQHLAEQSHQVLRVFLRISTAVAQLEVREPVGTEIELAAVVLVGRLVEGEQGPLGIRGQREPRRTITDFYSGVSQPRSTPAQTSGYQRFACFPATNRFKHFIILPQRFPSH